MKIAGQHINVSNLVICLVGIAVLAGVGIYPAHRTLKELDQTISSLQTQIEQQQLLFPVFVELLKRSREQLPPMLPAPEPEKLPRGNTAPLTKMFREIAAQNGILVDALRPDVESLIDGTDRLKMIADLSGGFQDLRNFLIQFGEISYLQEIEYLRLQAAPENSGLTVTLRFWVRQE